MTTPRSIAKQISKYKYNKVISTIISADFAPFLLNGTEYILRPYYAYLCKYCLVINFPFQPVIQIREYMDRLLIVSEKNIGFYQIQIHLIIQLIINYFDSVLIRYLSVSGLVIYFVVVIFCHKSNPLFHDIWWSIVTNQSTSIVWYMPLYHFYLYIP